MTQHDVLRSMLGSRGPGLEIGPLHNPVAAKRDGYDVEIVDHASTADLRAKYGRDPNVDVARIEQVDYVTDGRSMLEVIGQREKYDWIIASHVIEHTPNLLGFLQDCEALLRPTGTLVLAVPHRRFCFDALRPLTSMGQVLQAHLEKRTRLTPGTMFDYVSESSLRNGLCGWQEGYSGTLTRNYPLSTALAIFKREATPGADYADGHAWVFIPATFRLIMQMAHELGLLALRESGYHPAVGCEFFIALSRNGPGPGLSDDELRRAAEEEQLAGLLERFNLLPGHVTDAPADAPGGDAVGGLVVDQLRVLLGDPSIATKITGHPSLEAEVRIRALEAEVAEIRQSTSWRVTAPLRAIAGWMRAKGH